MEITKLITVEQLPIITRQLADVADGIKKRTDMAMSLVVSDDTIKDVKKVRAEMNKEFEQFDALRKAAKAAVMNPYDDFEVEFKKYITEPYKAAESALKSQIVQIEDARKLEKTNELREYFDELCQHYNLDLIGISEKAWSVHNPNVALSVSMPKLKEAAKEIVMNIADNLTAIESMENSAEILAEYKSNLNLSGAISIVADRHKRIADELARQDELAAKKADEAEVTAKVEAVMPAPEAPLAPPVATQDTPVDADPVLTLKFSVTAPKSKLKELKQFLIEGGYEFE